MFRVKQGSSLSFLMSLTDQDTGLPIDITGWTVTSGIKKRPEDTKKVGTFKVEVMNAAQGQLRISCETTNKWTPGMHVFDIRFNINGQVTVYSDEIELMVEASAT